MKHNEARDPLRVEHALSVLPLLEVLAPLRAWIAATSSARRFSSAGAVAEPDSTIGRRFFQPSEMRLHLPTMIAQVADVAAEYFAVALEALEADQRGDQAAVVRALLRGGAFEAKQLGRSSNAGQWFASALSVAESLRDRRPEIDTLQHLARLELDDGLAGEAARLFQRSFALAEAEGYEDGAAHACKGLAETALQQHRWQGAEAWCLRGRRHADALSPIAAELLLVQGRAAAGRGDSKTATNHFRAAADLSGRRGDAEGVARALHAEGNEACARGRVVEASEKYRAALETLARAERASELEFEVLLSRCNLSLQLAQLRETEDLIRHAEGVAIARNDLRSLARLYLLLGVVRARQRDENGFVFFEQALQLARTLGRNSHLEADIYTEYGRYRTALGEREDAAACFERARRIYERLGDTASLEHVRAEHSEPH